MCNSSKAAVVPESHPSPGVGDEVEEGRAEGSHAAVREHAVHHRGHAVLPHAEPHLAALVGIFLEDPRSENKQTNEVTARSH